MLQPLSPVLARYDPFGVDVPLNFDNTHSLTHSIMYMSPLLLVLKPVFANLTLSCLSSRSQGVMIGLCEGGRLIAPQSSWVGIETYLIYPLKRVCHCMGTYDQW